VSELYLLGQVFSVLLGLVIGSFMNVCIARMPQDRSVAYPPSHCPACGNGIRPQHNVPLLGWLWLRGRCYDCKTQISVLYPLVELLTGLLFWLVYQRVIPTPMQLDAAHLAAAGLLGVFVAMMVGLSFIDIRHFIIPDEFSIYAVPVGILGVMLVDWLGVAPPMMAANWRDAVVGAAVGGGVLAAIMGLYWIVRREVGMGLGDVKLVAMMGAFLGAAPAVPFILVVASMIGAVVGVVMALNGRHGLRVALPFGPFLAFAAVLYILHGPELVVRHFPGFALMFGVG
jgi:leader peptidase (prepilin peptidase)/N-methyltransferase